MKDRHSPFQGILMQHISREQVIPIQRGINHYVLFTQHVWTRCSWIYCSFM